jgi:hypothetical protein
MTLNSLQEMEATYRSLCDDWGWDIDEWGDQGSNHFDDPDGIIFKMVVLIETSRYDQIWITLHETAQAAAIAHDWQEYSDDWSCRDILDLRTGTQYEIRPQAVEVASELTPEQRDEYNRLVAIAEGKEP